MAIITPNVDKILITNETFSPSVMISNQSAKPQISLIIISYLSEGII